MIAVDTVHVPRRSLGRLPGGAVLALWRAGDRRWELAATAVPRFSGIAVVSVPALIVAGAITAYLQTRSVGADRHDLRPAGPAEGRAAAPDPRDGGGQQPALDAGARLGSGNPGSAAAVRPARVGRGRPGRRRAGADGGAGRGAARAGGGGGAGRPASATAEAGPFEVNIVVDPARPGANAVHLYLLDPKTGQPATADEAIVAASLPAADLGPSVALRPAGPGHYVITAADLPAAGDWQFTVGARVGDFDQYDATVDIPVKEELT